MSQLVRQAMVGMLGLWGCGLGGLGWASPALAAGRAIAPPIQQTTIGQVTQAIPLAASQPLLDLLRQGQSLYQAGQFTEAIALWRHLLQISGVGDQRYQILAWNQLALAYHNLGQVSKADEAIAQAQSLLADAPDSSLLKAQTLTTQGAIQLAKGQVEAALATWQQAEDLYQSAGDEIGALGSQLNQAQALHDLGLFRRAAGLLQQVNTRLSSLPDSALKAGGFHSLGMAHLRVGDFQEAKKALQSSLTLSEGLDLDTGSVLIGLGNIARAIVEQEAVVRADTIALSRSNPLRLNRTERLQSGEMQESTNFRLSQETPGMQEAIGYYRQAARSPSPLVRLQAQINQLDLLIRTRSDIEAIALLQTIQASLRTLPPSRMTVFAQVNVAESLIRWQQAGWAGEEAQTLVLAQSLAKAIQQAQQLNDQRAEAYAVGQLGHLYEITQQWSEAEVLTKQAIQLAQGLQASDILVPWQWQLGRIQKQLGKRTEAIAAYTEAIDLLYLLRHDILAIDPQAQFSFRDEVEPIYRQLVQLLLDGELSQTNLQKAIEVIEALQLAELNNFFREACLDVHPQQIDQIDPTAAVIHSIILPDRLAVILSLPGQPLKYFAPPLSPSNATNVVIEQTVLDLFVTLNPYLYHPNPLQPHQQLYDWLIQPIVADLEQHQIKTLVFVSDGILRGVPMAALHDGQKFLVEHYTIAVTPGLQLLPPRAIAPEELRVLAGGLSEERQGFPALPGVIEEVEQIAATLPAEVLLNQTFTQSQLQAKIDAAAYPIVHLATHGQFSSIAAETFLLTWEGRINVKEFDELLQAQLEPGQEQAQEPMQLLILSACQTAVGDNRAALGLAGVALRSGARSTIATLWSVQDDSTAELMSLLYQELNQPTVSKAEALRQAQLHLLRSQDYHHPYFWSAFVLIGNWL